jgi:hypothetical protein
MLQQDNIVGEIARKLIIAHGVPAKFEDNCLARMAAHIGQRLGQNLGLGPGPGRNGCGVFIHGAGL